MQRINVPRIMNKYSLSLILITSILCSSALGTWASGKKGQGVDKAKKSAIVLGITKKDYGYYLRYGQKSSKWDSFIQPAFQAFSAGHLATASIFLQKAYDNGCRDPLVLFRLAIFKEARNDLNGAISLLSQAESGLKSRYKKHPVNLAIHKQMGQILYSQSKYADALPHLMLALKWQPDDFMLLFMIGDILAESNRMKDARKFLENAISHLPIDGGDNIVKSRVALLHELVIVTYKLGDIDACDSYIGILTSIDPSDSLAASYGKKVNEYRMHQKEMNIINKFVK